jgi:hypothetical protein
MIDMVVSYLGVIGAVLCILAYFLLERGLLGAPGFYYYAINGIGAAFVLLAVVYSFDGGDIGAVLQELCWVLVSVIGVYKTFKIKSETKK